MRLFLFPKNERRAWPIIVVMPFGVAAVMWPHQMKLKIIGITVVAISLLTAIVGWGSDKPPIEKEPYTVQEGDTLWHIASERWEGDPREGVRWIREKNSLESPIIHPGETILVPKKEETE